MRLGRPRLHAGLIVLAITVALAAVSPAAAGSGEFKRDRTPLPSSVGEGSPASEAGSGGAFARVALGLVLVILLVYGIYWLLKRSSRGRTPAGASNVTIVATTPLGPNRAVHLLRVGDELVLVGSAEQGVSRIRVYPPDEARALEDAIGRAQAMARGGPAKGAGVSTILDDLRRKTAR